MKKILALMAGVALLFTSTIFTSCSDSDDDSSSVSISSNKTGSIVGVVLDNRGEPVEGATVTLGTKSATTNYGGEFEITNVAVNDAKKVTTTSSVVTGDGVNAVTTAYTLTAKKDGYLSSTVKGIYVTYEEKETVKSATYRAALSASLQAQYATILNTYAGNTTNSTQAATTIVGTAAGTDVGYSQTTTNTNDISSVMTIIANALKDLESLYKDTEFNVETYADFASAALIPCDASFTGALKLNLTPIEASSYSAETFVPKSKPTVRMSYTPTDKNAYTFTAKVDENGKFEFKNLPSGVALSFTVDAFTETIDNTEYYFSGEAARYILDNSSAYQAAPLTGTPVTLGSGDSNEKSCVLMLHAQKDKIWVTDSNVIASATGTLLSVKDPLTFTFNKEMKVLALTAEKISDITAGRYTVTIDSTDAKKVTVTPIDGVWTLTSNPATITLTGEAVDGTKVIIGGNKGSANATEAAGADYAATYDAYFDTYIWASIVTESHNNEDSALALNTPIVLEFSKPMAFANVTITGTANTFTKAFSEDKKTLTLTPKNIYWDITTPATNNTTVVKEVTITVTGEDTDGNTTVGYWKTNSAAAGLKAYFNDTLDVTLANASTATQEAFTIKFNKEIKSFDVKGTNNLVSIKSGNNDVTDYTAEFDGKDTVTVKARDGLFAKEGPYTVTLKDIEPVDGSDMVREAGKSAAKAYVTSKTYTFKTSDFNFSYDGVTLKPVAIEVVNTLPASAKLSRAAIIDATTDQYLKLSFNKNIYKSAITLKTGDKATTATAEATAAKNYIDGKDVYVALADVANVKKVLVLADLDTVKAVDGDTLVKDDSGKFTDWDKLTTDLEFRIYAALTLEDSSLVAKTPDVNGYKTYKEADPVANKTVTFTFDKELPATYTAEVDLYSYDATSKKYKKSVDTEKLTWATASKTITFTSDKLLPVLDKETNNTVGTSETEVKSVYTNHYLSLVVKNEAGVVLFSTKTANFDSAKGTDFEKAFAGLVDSGSDTTAGKSEQKFNTVIVKVAPYAITNYSLVTEKTDVAGKKSYVALPAVPAKTPLVFTFNALPAGATATYDLKDSTDKAIESAVAATVNATANTVTIASDKLVFDADKADSTNGRTTYYVTLSVKDAAGNIVFTTDKAQKAQFAVVKDSYESKLFGTSPEVKDKDGENVSLYSTAKKTLEVKVAPLTLEGISFVKATVNPLDETDITYKALNPIAPKASVDFTFSEDLTGASVTAKIYGPESKATVGTVKELEKLTLVPAGKKVTVQSDKMLSYKTDASTSYYVALEIIKDGKKLFSTNSDYFGVTTNKFENKAVKAEIAYDDEDFNGTGAKTTIQKTDAVATGSGKTIKVDVVKTNVVTIKEKKDSTTTTSTQFAESYNHDIVLEFTHNVGGYTAVLYKDITAPVVTLGSESKLTVWSKDNAASIYATAVVPADSNKVTLALAANNFFTDNETVKVAIFDDSTDKVCIIGNVAVVDKDKNTKTYTAKHDEAAAEDTWLKALTPVALPITDAEIAKAGNGQTVEFGPLEVKFNEKKTSQAEYKVYIKDYSSTTVSNEAWRDITSVTPAVVTKVYKDADGVEAANITYQDYKLHNFNKVYFKVTFAADAFGFGESVDVAVLETLDSSRVLYSKTGLVDKVAPVVTLGGVNKSTPTGTLTITKEDSTTTSVTFRIPDTKKLNELVIEGIGANAHAADNSSTPPVVAGDAVKADFVLDLSGDEWLATAVATVSTTHENSNATSGKTKTNATSAGKVEWTGAGVGKIAFKDTLWFKGDVITLKAKDAKGNEAIYTITIKD